MDSVLRKFRLRKERRESEARQKLKKELFAFNNCVGHGFPSKPSALAYDPVLKLLAIGTKSGDLLVCGAPGVEFSGKQDGNTGVSQINFLPGQGRLVTVTSDNSVHLWQINETDGHASLSLVKSLSGSSSGLKTIQASCVSLNGEQLILGVDGGSIQFVDILSFKLSDRVIHLEAIVAHAPEEVRSNPGNIIAVLQHPSAHKFLVGYNRGVIVLWDDNSNSPTHTYNTSQQLESVSFFRDGNEFLSVHSDGSYVIWGAAEAARPKDLASTPYGPFPCKAINKMVWKSAKPEPFTIFSGGMPRASHGDRNTVTIMQGSSHVVLDLTSKVIDFAVLCGGDEIGSSDFDDPHSLVILTEEELIVIDLTSEGWLTYNLPYLHSIHSSAILSATHVSSVPESFWNKLQEVGARQLSGHSTQDWPISGGYNSSTKPESHDLLLTSHEDGSVKFWDVSTTSMHLIYKLSTSGIFGFETHQSDLTKSQELEDEWPPFRKIGSYDPYSDDPQLGIQKIAICCQSETLVLGGTAGQIIVLKFAQTSQKLDIQVSSVSIVADSDNYVWKGHDPLAVRSGETNYPAGFQPQGVIQLYPPSLCKSLALQTDWKLLAIGTAFGYAVFDYHQNKQVYTKCTLDAPGGRAAPRRRSLRRSIRESFRRLRGRRAGQHHKAEHRGGRTVEVKVEEIPAEQASSQRKDTDNTGQIEAAPSTGAGDNSSPPSPSGASPSTSPKHVEAKAESRSSEDVTTSIARCIYFADTFLLNAQEHNATLWVGTNAGTVFIHQIVLPSGDHRDTESVTCILAKEIQLRHGAPVILVSVVDRTMLPISEPHVLEQGKSPDMSGGHQVVICSEEQFKLFSLPNLKPSTKYKFTARDGTKVQKANIISFKSKSDENYVEHDLACLTNSGYIYVFNVPQLRNQLKANGIGLETSCANSGLFTVNGEGFFLKSASEYARLSLSARRITRPVCTIGLAEGTRLPLHLEDAESRSAAQEQQPVTDAVAAERTAVANGVVDDPAVQHHNVSGDGGSKAAGPTTSDDVDATGAPGEMVSLGTVKMQMSESSSSSVVVRNVTSSRTVVTKTTVSRTTDDGGTVTETSTDIQHMNTGQVRLSGSENLVPADGVQEH